MVDVHMHASSLTTHCPYATMWPSSNVASQMSQKLQKQRSECCLMPDVTLNSAGSPLNHGLSAWRDVTRKELHLAKWFETSASVVLVCNLQILSSFKQRLFICPSLHHSKVPVHELIAAPPSASTEINQSVSTLRENSASTTSPTPS